MKNSRSSIKTICACSVIPLLACGCTSTALDDSVIMQGNTISSIEQEMVLDNLEMFHHNPDARPWHVKITSGVVSVNDTINPSLSYAWSPVLNTLGLSASRSVQLQWTVLPVTDPGQLRGLASLYQANVGAKQTAGGAQTQSSCLDAQLKPIPFDQTFEEGFAPPTDRPHGSYADKYIWVRNGAAAQDCFDKILNDTIGAAPVTAADLSTPIPGAFPHVGK